jgi:hypothetical protein
VQDVELLSRDPKRSKTAHVVGPLPTNCPDREKTYSELSVSLGQVGILEMGVRRGVSCPRTQMNKWGPRHGGR